MKILLINGSPRKNGNTQLLLNLYAEEICSFFAVPEDNVESVLLTEENIQMCHGCRSCMENSEDFCPCKDNIKKIQKQMTLADIIVIASPVYVEDVSGLTKLWIDRMAFACHRPFLNGKIVYLFTTSGAKASNHAITTLKHALLSWGAIVISSQNYSMGKKMQAKNVRPTFKNSIQRQIQQNSFKTKKIPLYSLIAFGIQKKYWLKQGKKMDSFDYQYWKTKAWLEKNSFYYMPVKISFIKKMILSFIVAFVGKMLY